MSSRLFTSSSLEVKLQIQTLFGMPKFRYRNLEFHYSPFGISKDLRHSYTQAIKYEKQCPDNEIFVWISDNLSKTAL